MSAETGLFIKSQLRVVGFGFYRQQLGEPWFSYGEYRQNMLQHPYGRKKEIAESSFSRLSKKLVQLGYMERHQLNTQERMGRIATKTKVLARITDEAADPMLNTITHLVTHTGETVPSLLLAPEVAKVVLENTDLEDRVIAAISGVPKLPNTIIDLTRVSHR